MSHKPVSPDGNFLILPKRHQCTWDLTAEEALASFEAVIALKKMFLGSKHWVCYIQDGRAVGQTVPHTHIHFYMIPDSLRCAISSLQHIHNQRPILSYEEMRIQCEKIKSYLFKEHEGTLFINHFDRHATICNEVLPCNKRGLVGDEETH